MTANAASQAASGVDANVNLLAGDLVTALPGAGLRALDGQPHPLADGAGDESAHRVRMPVGCLHDLGHGRAALAIEQVEDDGLLRECLGYSGFQLLRGGALTPKPTCVLRKGRSNKFQAMTNSGGSAESGTESSIWLFSLNLFIGRVSSNGSLGLSVPKRSHGELAGLSGKTHWIL